MDRIWSAFYGELSGCIWKADGNPQHLGKAEGNLSYEDA